LSVILRALTLPGADYILPLVCTPVVCTGGNLVGAALSRLGIRATPAVEEIWRSFTSLADADCRRSFFRTLRSVVDAGGQAVTATDRLYLTALVPTLLVWGALDPFIPVSHAVAAHAAVPGSRLEIFDTVGHYPHCEAPERFVEVLVDFIASTEPARLSEAHWRALLRSSSAALEAAGIAGAADLHAAAVGYAGGSA
jgi:pimeloyl-ACP methyl ester carboxylesterase